MSYFWERGRHLEYQWYCRVQSDHLDRFPNDDLEDRLEGRPVSTLDNHLHRSPGLMVGMT